MPKIQWERLPREKWTHLRDRARERKISEEDLFDLAEWKAQDPDVPDALDPQQRRVGLKTASGSKGRRNSLAINRARVSARPG
jgi:hypothetical protein